MEHKSTPRLDWPAVMDRHVWCLARINPQLLEHPMKGDPVKLMADADAQRAFSIMGAHHDRGMFKTRIANPRHGEQQVPSQITCFGHGMTLMPALALATCAAAKSSSRGLIRTSHGYLRLRLKIIQRLSTAARAT